VLYKQQQYWQAAKAFEQAAAAAPDRAVYHYHLGLAHLRDGRRPDARRAFSRAGAEPVISERSILLLRLHWLRWPGFDERCADCGRAAATSSAYHTGSG
jgi:tetratricopeptide (TPR) repeat protein